jgi:hypothetical protein
VLPKKIYFGPVVRAPEEDFFISFPDAADHAFQRKALFDTDVPLRPEYDPAGFYLKLGSEVGSAFGLN